MLPAVQEKTIEVLLGLSRIGEEKILVGEDKVRRNRKNYIVGKVGRILGRAKNIPVSEVDVPVIGIVLP